MVVRYVRESSVSVAAIKYLESPIVHQSTVYVKISIAVKMTTQMMQIV